MRSTLEATPLQSRKPMEGTVFAVILAIACSHLLNDALQSLIPAVYPLVKDAFHLSFTEVGLIALTFQLSASLLQPVVGSFTDQRPQPFSLAVGMAVTLCGLVVLSFAPTFPILLVAVALIGVGSSIFHPEASRVTYVAASIRRRGLAQSIFQVGGRFGAALGPLLAALIVVRIGLSHMWWFGAMALMAIVLLIEVGRWYRRNLHLFNAKFSAAREEGHRILSQRQVSRAIVILLVLIFSKFFYLAAMSSYLTFYLMFRFGVSVQVSQLYLFAFLASSAIGTMLGGPLGDYCGRKYVIWFSILGAAPFTLLLPHVNLFWTGVLIVVIGLILSSAFPAILVYAQELLPRRLGMVSGLFYGFAFGMGGIGSALLGVLADHTSIVFVYAVCAYLPLIGLLTGFLPRIRIARRTEPSVS
jgi:FSR family fosmidomycin resistance protein-like MFS transporter